jgi:PPOX class probable F420-dependent enzyme
MIAPSAEVSQKLSEKQIIWFSCVRPGGRPHLTPVWYVWLDGKIYISSEAKSVKVGAVRANPRVALSLEDGEHPVICEGTARLLDFELDERLRQAFFAKYEWDLNKEEQYRQVVEITPVKWLSW